tara:strand:+ start:732 stop:2093 length:1362 start_codon:yes stop_codon:yes gene_type:complete
MKLMDSSSSPSFQVPRGLMAKGTIAIVSVSIGQWLLSDIVHLPGGGFGLLALGAGAIWFCRPARSNFAAPSTVNGWVKRCLSVLDQFQELEEGENSFINLSKRSEQLKQIIDRTKNQTLSVVTSSGESIPSKEDFKRSLSKDDSLSIILSEPLPISDSSWVWPSYLEKNDFIIYCLNLPLSASDLIWLKKIPENQPSWIFVQTGSSLIEENLNVLKSQLPDRWEDNLIRFDSNREDSNLNTSLRKVNNYIGKKQKNIDNTTKRLLESLHQSWQADLEKLRRTKFKAIQNRSQWVVAGSVFASPITSTDLLSVAVVNGIMIKEMSDIWACKVSPSTLQVVAKCLVSASIAQGIIEWSGNALIGAAKFHSHSWLAAGAMQALSAAYLTRVVGRSMADWMALNNGVSDIDLELLKEQSTQLVKRAADEERLDWLGFLNQSREWIESRSSSSRSSLC